MTNVKMVQIGELKITLFSLIVLITGVVLGVFMAFLVPHPYGLMSSLVIILASVVFAYNVNCMVVGQCKIWALVLTAFYVLYATFVVIKLFSMKSVVKDMIMSRKSIKKTKY